MSRRNFKPDRTIKKEVKRLIRISLADKERNFTGFKKNRPGLVFTGQKAPKWPRYFKKEKRTRVRT